VKIHRLVGLGLLATGMALAAEQNLLNLVMPDAKVVIGINIDQAKASPFGQYLLGQMPADDPGLQKFLAVTGFDPRKNISQVVIASAGPAQNANSDGFVAVKGTFDVTKIEAAAQEQGASMTPFSGVEVISGPHVDKVVAFPNDSTAILGDRASVQAAISRFQGAAGLSAANQTTVQTASAGQDAWFVALAPISQFVPSGAANGGPLGASGNLFTKVQQASGGVKFGDPVKVSAEAVTDSAQDAQAMVDALRFLIGMLAMNKQNDPVAAMVSNLLDALQLGASANTMTLSLSIPESQLESLVTAMQKQQQNQQHERGPMRPHGHGETVK